MNVIKVIYLNKWPRATIRERLSKSYSEKVHVTLHAEFDVERIKELKDKLTSLIQEKYGARLTYTAIFVKLVAHVLRKHIDFNAVVEEDEVKVIDDININVAVQSEKLGLVTPVIRNVDKKTLGTIAVELNDVVDRAREGKLTIRDMKDGTFTITNFGMLGSVDAFTPIINPPQVAILGIGRIIDKPMVIDGQIAIRPTCTFSLTFDHVVIDGYQAAEFLATLKNMIDNPMDAMGELI